MQKMEWQSNRERERGFLGAAIVSVVGVAGLIALGLALTGGDSDEASEAVSLSGRQTVALAASRVERAAPPATLVASEESEIAAIEPAEIETPEISGPPAPVTYTEAEAAFFEADYEHAVDLFTTYTAQKPDNAWGHYMRGLSLWKADRLEEAAGALGDALTINPGHLKSMVNLARVRIEQKQYEEALEPIRVAIELDPTNGNAYRVQGRAAHSLGLIEEAIDAYHNALTWNGTDAWSLNNLGLIYIEGERFEEALPPLAKAVSIDNGVAVFQNNLAVALERTGHAALAAESFALAFELDSTYEKAFDSYVRVSALADAENEPEIDLEMIAGAWAPSEREAEIASTNP